MRVQEFENVIKDIYDLDIEVHVEKTHRHGKPCHRNRGGYDPIEKYIIINYYYEFKNSKEIKDTLVHEGRHAWQDIHGYMNKNNIKHADEYSYDEYYNSPIEKDARWAVDMYNCGKIELLKEESFHLWSCRPQVVETVEVEEGEGDASDFLAILDSIEF